MGSSTSSPSTVNGATTPAGGGDASSSSSVRAAAAAVADEETTVQTPSTSAVREVRRRRSSSRRRRRGGGSSSSNSQPSKMSPPVRGGPKESSSDTTATSSASTTRKKRREEEGGNTLSLMSDSAAAAADCAAVAASSTPAASGANSDVANNNIDNNLRRSKRVRMSLERKTSESSLSVGRKKRDCRNDDDDARTEKEEEEVVEEEEEQVEIDESELGVYFPDMVRPCGDESGEGNNVLRFRTPGRVVDCPARASEASSGRVPQEEDASLSASSAKDSLARRSSVVGRLKTTGLEDEEEGSANYNGDGDNDDANVKRGRKKPPLPPRRLTETTPSSNRRSSLRRAAAAVKKSKENEFTALTIEPKGEARNKKKLSSSKEGFFPPTIFTDAIYTKGILVYADTNTTKSSSSGMETMTTATLDYDYFLPNAPSFDSTHIHKQKKGTQRKITRAAATCKGDDDDGGYQYGGCHSSLSASSSSSSDLDTEPQQQQSNDHSKTKKKKRFLPILTPMESTLWNSKYGAISASNRRFPMEAVRLLGTITLHLHETEVKTMRMMRRGKEEEPVQNKKEKKEQTDKSKKGRAASRKKKRRKVTKSPQYHSSFTSDSTDEEEDEDSSSTTPQKRTSNPSSSKMKNIGPYRYVKPWSKRANTNNYRRQPRDTVSRITKRYTRHMAMTEARTELAENCKNNDVDSIDEEKREKLIEKRANMLLSKWKEICNEEKPKKECWDVDGFVSDSLGDDDRFVPISALRSWVRNRDAPTIGGGVVGSPLEKEDEDEDEEEQRDREWMKQQLLEEIRAIQEMNTEDEIKEKLVRNRLHRLEEEFGVQRFDKTDDVEKEDDSEDTTGGAERKKKKRRGQKRKRTTTQAASRKNRLPVLCSLTSAATESHRPAVTIRSHVTPLDDQGKKKLSLYNGLREIPIDVHSVLHSLQEMSNPVGLYDVPLITPYAIADVVDEEVRNETQPLSDDHDGDANHVSSNTNKKKKNQRSSSASKSRRKTTTNTVITTTTTNRKWQIRIGIYTSRLLPEVLTCHHLHVIMSALDPDSYVVTEPLHLPPMSSGREVFRSCNYPEVDLNAVVGHHVMREETPPLKRGGIGGSNSNSSLTGVATGTDDQFDECEMMDCLAFLHPKPTPASSSMSSSWSRGTPSSSSSKRRNNNNRSSSGKKKKKARAADGSSSDRPIVLIDDVDDTIKGSTRVDELKISPFTIRGLLKLMENTGTDVTMWPQIRKIIQPTLQLNLMLHQIHAVCWMISMEHLGGFGINSILWEERQFLDGGKYYYSPALGQIRLGKPPVMKGGLLCDEMGLGKTVEVLGLILATMEELKEEAAKANSEEEEGRVSSSEDEVGGAGISSHVQQRKGGKHTHATLIIVPPALVVQWSNEIRKAVGTALEVHVFDAKTLEFDVSIASSAAAQGNKRSGGKGAGHDKEENINHPPDIVITTYNALEKPKSSKILESIHWGRIVLDEMQEIRSSTTSISKNCERLSCQNRRWMLSGTPLFESIDDLRGELNFLRLEPFAAKLEDGFFDFAITNHWKLHSIHGLETLRILGLLMLRRAKDMTIVQTGMPLLGLKDLTVEFVPVPQDPNERALYCWMEYLVSEELAWNREQQQVQVQVVATATASTGGGNSNGGGGSRDGGGSSRSLCLRLLRELCISPVLLNGGLGVSSQLSTINTLMIKANRRLESAQLNSLQRLDDDDEGGSSTSRKRPETTRILSCDESLRFLTQVQHAVSVREDFVSDVGIAGGRGVTHRNQAQDSVEVQFKAVEKEVKAAEWEKTECTRKKVKAMWHLLLERITSGGVAFRGSCVANTVPSRVSKKYLTLWMWRHALIEMAKKRTTPMTTRVTRSSSSGGGSSSKLPPLLMRGWRPSPSFLRRDLFLSHPDYAWAHPIAPLQLDDIPTEVTVEEVQEALYQAAKREPHARQLHKTCVAKLENNKKKKKPTTNGSSSSSAKPSDPIAKLKSQLKEAEENMTNARLHDSTMKRVKVIPFPTITAAAAASSSTNATASDDSSSSSPPSSFWRATLHFADESDSRFVMRKASGTNGLTLPSDRKVPHVEEQMEVARSKLCQAESENKVYPCPVNQRSEAVARKELHRASLGLRIIFDEKKVASAPSSPSGGCSGGDDGCPCRLSRSITSYRALTPHTTATMIESTTRSISQYNERMYRANVIIGKGRDKLARLRPALGRVSEEIQGMSAFETLEALAAGEYERTRCPICLGSFCSEVTTCPSSSSSSSRQLRGKSQDQCKKNHSLVAMINCGHFFCIPCLETYAHDRISNYQSLACPNCRKSFSLSRDVIHIDPTIKEDEKALEHQRDQAKRKVRQACKMLETSNGQLDAEMWHALFLSFDLPVGMNRRRKGHSLFTAIPKDVLAHLRCATGMEVHCHRNDRPPPAPAAAATAGMDDGSLYVPGRSSKVRALLSDLPRTERSVVFTGSRDCVKHLVAVLEMEGIGCRSLFTGQMLKDSEKAVADWEAEDMTSDEDEEDHDDGKKGTRAYSSSSSSSFSTTMASRKRRPPPCPVLIVQAGAAASGLTLTSASKIFLMEPFARQEEEQQAYARCHRYGQTQPVYVKCYYAPVSVESRLLDWRQRAAKAAGGASAGVAASANTTTFNDDVVALAAAAAAETPSSGGDGYDPAANVAFTRGRSSGGGGGTTNVIYSSIDVGVGEVEGKPDLSEESGVALAQTMAIDSSSSSSTATEEDARRSMFLLGLLDNNSSVDDDEEEGV